MKSYPFILRACLALLASLALTSTALAQPTLVSVTPASGTSGVPTNTTLVFQFSERMNLTPPADGTFFVAIAPGNTLLFIDELMTYEWISDRSFTARCTGGFPAGATINWVINDTEFTRFIDDSELLQGYSGTFTTAAASGGGDTTATNDLVLSVCVFGLYRQDSNSVPVVDPLRAALFHADAKVPTGRGITNVVLTPPGKPSFNLTGIPFFAPTSFLVAVQSNSVPLLEASFPSGGYLFSVQSPNSNQNLTVTQPAGTVPAAPQVQNFPAAQLVDAALPFSLQFAAGGVATEFVSVEIEDPVSSTVIFESAGYLASGALNGTSNHVRIAAGTFQPGRSYDVRLQRFVVQSNRVAGAVQLSGYGSITQSKIRTIGGATSHIVRITDPTRLGNTFGVVVSLGTNATYHFERTVDFTNWVSVQTLVPTSTNLQAVVDIAPPNGSAFYRFRRE